MSEKESSIKTYQDIPKATNKEVLDFLRGEIGVVLKKANLYKKIFVACFNEILRDIERRLGVDNNLNRKESKPYLCQICKVCETCQNNFDYECVLASDFLCYDIKCGSFAECDKIHCHQFYVYTNMGIIKRVN